MKPDHFFGGRASPVSGDCAHFWGLYLPFAELPALCPKIGHEAKGVN